MANNEIMVSVVMFSYNHERYIRQALDGVLSQQTDFPFEIIIHDDASTDRSAEIIAEYVAKYPEIVRPICQTENQYSKGTDIAKTFTDPLIRGKYRACCECDDFWCDPHKLQKQVDFLEANPTYVASAHNCRFVDADGNDINSIYGIYRPYRSHRYTLKRLSRDVVYPGQTATVIYRMDACRFESPEQEKAFYDMRLPTGDKRLCLQLLLAGDIYCFEDKMSAYRIVTQGGDSWTARTKEQNRSYILHVASIDMRRYVRKFCHRPFANYYTTFHTGAAVLGKRLLKPTEENKTAFRQLAAEHGGVLGTLFYLIGLGIVSVPLHFVRKAERTRYDP